MKKGKYSNVKDLAYYSSLGLTIAMCIFIGLFAGVYLDRRFDTAPVLTLVFLGFGIAAGFRSIAKAIKKSRKM